MNYQTYIIAEAGVNHNGSFEMAKQLVDVAKKSGVDAVKFQTFRTENLVTDDAKQADYQVSNLGEETTQFEMLKELELSYEEFFKLKKYCDILEIEFLSTPFDFESVDFLIDQLEMKKVKISSGELTNSPFIHYIATKQKPMIVSTGMATMEEIHVALSFIAYGLAFPTKRVMVKEVLKFYKTKRAKELLQTYVTVLHCTTEYPAQYDSINLRVLQEMKKELKIPIGFSDHSEGITIPIAATTFGIAVIEKHFTLSRNLEGPDHRASLEPKELKEMVKAIRTVEKSLGFSDKKPSKIELENRIAARKSLVAKIPIQSGEVITEKHLTVKRPGNGMSPNTFWEIIGKRSTNSYEKDALIDE